MPLSAMCVSAVSSRPRLWSSHVNIRQDVPSLAAAVTMNSTEEISVYRNPPDYYRSPTLGKRVPSHAYDFPEKTSKKDKKWSLGSLFRRKKREDSASSSDDDQKRSFLGRRRRKSDGKRKKPVKTVGTFDHVVHPRAYNGYHHHEDTGILSDPSGGFSNYTGRLVPQSAASIGSADSISKKNKKDCTKARAAARRTVLGHDSSSDEDSQRSNSSLRIRSDESLAKHLDGSYSRKSRAARTERYLKRHSRDGENPYNYLKLSKSDADDSNKSPSRSPNLPPSSAKFSRNSLSSSQTSGLSTVPPSHGVHGKFRVSNSTSNPSYKPPLSMNEYNNARSYSCETFDDSVIHVQFPIVRPGTRGYNLLESARNPPQPPPRDPKRSVVSHSRPSTCYFDPNQPKPKSFHGYLPSRTPNSFNFHPSHRSSSEMNLPNDSVQIQSTVRPASTTPEPKTNKYRYLTDKSPRSRKPIFIQTNTKSCEPRKDSPTQKALDFWKQIEEDVDRSCRKPVQMFTSQTHVQSQVFLPRSPSPFKPVSPMVEDVDKRKSSNLEEALDELEAIYNSLRLGDEDLLDRAEQKEKELQQQSQSMPSRGALSDSSFSYEPFGQKKRRSKMPDAKQDDMYKRKLNREKSATISDPQSVISSVSYLLASPVHGGSLDDGAINTDGKEPDVTYDDMLYRNVKRSLSSPKTVDPQPPFGIPLGPVAPAPNSDYLHATPVYIYQPVYKSRKIPDVVKDDLAFRNLRKDSNKEPVLPSKNAKLDLNYLKKRRAVRSLSANIGNLLQKDKRDEDVETLTDIADAMEIAKKVLEEKGKTITATKKAFMSDTEAKPAYSNGESIKESRLKFLDSLRCSKSPESTKSSLDDLLDSLAKEAKITTDRITRELEELEERKKAKVLDSIDSRLSPEVAEPMESAPADADTVTQVSESDHDYENVGSDQDKENDKTKKMFQDLDEIKVPRFDNKTASVYDNLVEGEHRFDACLEDVASSPTNTFNRESVEPKLEPSDSLKSPKLVLETTKRKAGDGDGGGSSKTSPWYRDPAKVAVACSYGLACAHQLASVDLVTVVSILLAVISFLAALFI